MVSVSKNIWNVNEHGFTLIELIVVITIIGILFVVVGTLFNPLGQIHKANNATRQHDLNEIKSALDAYFNDTGCYPLSIPFGSSWTSGKTVYMQKVPEDVSCSSTNPANCYVYQTNGSVCPQWNILYAQLQQPIDTSIPTCVLNRASSCLPSGGMQSYNYCVVSGALDCPYISQNALPSPTIPTSNAGNNNAGNGGNTGATPTPSINCSGSLSACSNGICNVEAASQCVGCGGVMQCYNDLMCGGVSCN